MAKSGARGAKQNGALPPPDDRQHALNGPQSRPSANVPRRPRTLAILTALFVLWLIALALLALRVARGA